MYLSYRCRIVTHAPKHKQTIPTDATRAIHPVYEQSYLVTFPKWDTVYGTYNLNFGSDTTVQELRYVY
jgi:hypothetical protein